MTGGPVASIFTSAQAAAIIPKPPVALFAAVLALAGAATPAGAANEIGRATDIVQTVSGQLNGTLRWLVRRDIVHQDEVIETSMFSSACEITFLDRTRLALGPNSRVKLDRFVFDPDPANGKFAMTAIKGAFRFASGNLSKESYAIRTPTATMGVRGTVFSSVIHNGVTAVVLDCKCRQRRPASVTVSGSAGKMVELDRCGIATIVHPGAPPTPPGPCPGWVIARLEELDRLLGNPTDYENATGDPEDIADIDDIGDVGDPGDTGGTGGGNRSGLGDDTNPGQGGGRDNSSNEGSDNPGGG